MSRSVTPCAALASLLLPVISALPSAAAQSTFRLGTEFQVNSRTEGGQGEPAVARDADGDFVAVWTDEAGLNDNNIVGRRYDSLGVAQGAVFVVNTYTPHGQFKPSVAMDASGRFVVVWAGNFVDYGPTQIFARRFDALGVAQGGEVQVNSYTMFARNLPEVARDADGDFVVVWQSQGQDGPDDGIFGRRFDSAGVALGVEFQVNAATVGSQVLPSIAVEADGDFVVAWTDVAGGGAIRARRFNSTGVGGAELPVTTGSVIEPGVALDGDGDFVVVWTDAAQRDGSGSGIFGRRFNALGGPEGAEFQVNGYTYLSQRYPTVDAAAGGRFVVVWGSFIHDGANYGIFARTFDANGAAQGEELQVNTYTAGNETLPSLATDADGDFVVVWHTNGQDGSNSGAFAQRFAVLTTIDVDGNGQFTPLTDGLLILRWGFGFTGATLTTGVVGAGCQRCDAASITTYLQSLN